MKLYDAEDTLLNGVCFQDITEAGFKSLICLVHVHKETSGKKCSLICATKHS